MKPKIFVCRTILFLLPCLAQAMTFDNGMTLSGSGFLTLAAGKVLGGDSPQDFNGYHAPMFVADYAQGGIYQDNGWTLRPDSKLGLQGSLEFNPSLSLTAQVVSRGTRGGKVNLEWAYANYFVNDRLTLQIGRKRLPLFYYSETQDVGFTLPWTHLPPGQYGWEVVNYDGANLLYRDEWGEWTSGMNFFAGNEKRKDNPYQKIYNGRETRTDSKWSNILGADVTLTRGWFEARAAYIQSDIQNRFEDPASPPPYVFSPKAKQNIYSLSGRYDDSHWLIIGEYLYTDRKQMGDEFFSVLGGVGYRVGKLLPMITYNAYRERLRPGPADPNVVDLTTIDPLSREAFSIMALLLRYNLTANSDVKIQFDRWYDRSGPNFNGGVPYGNPRLVSISYDLIF